MTKEEKAKAYDEAIETCKRVFNFDNLSYTHCEIKERLEQIFPELSEDERIRKALVKTFEKKLENGFEWIEFGIPNRSVLDWLKKQQEQKPSISCGHENDIEWSEEDATCLEYALWCVMKTRNFVAKDACDLDACRCAERWLESLRPRSHWKPTEEQMKKLNIAIACYEGDWGEDNAKPLRELYEELKKL